MSIFGKFRSTHKAAGEQKPDDSRPKPAPYKHVPTHAASDSLACAPPGWRRVEDRKAILAQYKRRSEMSRSTSGLSVVTTLHRGRGHHTDDWTTTTMDQRNTRPPLPALPHTEASRGISPLHASAESAPVHACDRGTSSESSNSLSSRGSSPLEIPPRNSRRTPRGEPRTSHVADGAECGPWAAEAAASGVVLHVHQTGQQRRAAQSTPRELEPAPPAFGPHLRPPGPIGEAMGRSHEPFEEGRRLSKSSVYNNIHRTTHRRTADSPTLSTPHGPKYQPTPSTFAPMPERAVGWDPRLVLKEDPPYPHIVAH